MRVWFPILRRLPRALAFRVAVCTLLLTMLLSCSPQPTPFAIRQAIPLGFLTVTVSGTDSVAGNYFDPAGSRHSAAGMKSYAVFLDIATAEPEQVKLPRIILFLAGVRLVDSDGNRYRAAAPMPAEQYNLLKSARAGGDWTRFDQQGKTVPRQWVVLFLVPETSHGLTLLLPNPRPTDDQPRLAAVQLR